LPLDPKAKKLPHLAPPSVGEVQTDVVPEQVVEAQSTEQEQGVERPTASGKPARLTDATRPDFWPKGLDPRDNQQVADWLLGRGDWAGQSAGWKNYEIKLSDAAMRPGTWPWATKRAMDLCLTIPGLLLVSPIMLATAIALKVSAPFEPVLFKQSRPGYLCKPFSILKFRTMKSEGNSESPNGDAERITFTGRILRRTSLDELPQLFNVLAGQMSLVGPRPQLLTYLTRYKKASIFRHAVLPGIVGENQVHSRNDCTWASRMDDDLRYVKNRSIFRDLFLAFAGPFVALLGRGTKAEGTASMVEMSGEWPHN